MPAMSPINLVTMAVCLCITIFCYLRLATAAISLACSGDQLGVLGGCGKFEHSAVRRALDPSVRTQPVVACEFGVFSTGYCVCRRRRHQGGDSGRPHQPGSIFSRALARMFSRFFAGVLLIFARLFGQTKPVFEYVGGRVTGLPSGFCELASNLGCRCL